MNLWISNDHYFDIYLNEGCEKVRLCQRSLRCSILGDLCIVDSEILDLMSAALSNLDCEMLRKGEWFGVIDGKMDCPLYIWNPAMVEESATWKHEITVCLTTEKVTPVANIFIPWGTWDDGDMSRRDISHSSSKGESRGESDHDQNSTVIANVGRPNSRRFGHLAGQPPLRSEQFWTLSAMSSFFRWEIFMRTFCEGHASIRTSRSFLRSSRTGMKFGL